MDLCTNALYNSKKMRVQGGKASFVASVEIWIFERRNPARMSTPGKFLETATATSYKLCCGWVNPSFIIFCKANHRDMGEHRLVQTEEAVALIEHLER